MNKKSINVTTEEFINAIIANAKKQRIKDDFYTQEEVEEKVRAWVIIDKHKES